MKCDASVRFPIAESLLVTLTLGACATVGEPSTVYVGPVFWDGQRQAAAVEVDSDGRITALHDDVASAPRGLPVVELPGALALPGLVDAHLHLAWIGRTQEQVDLTGLGSLAAVVARVEAFAKAHPELAVIEGHGWDQTLWPESLPESGMPTAVDLPADPRPIVLSRIDGHALWLNDAALTLIARELEGPDPQATRVLRDSRHRPTGVLIDPPSAWMKLLAPAPTAGDLRRHLARGMTACADVGLVEVTDMATSVPELETLEALSREARLPLRVVVYLDDSDASFAWAERVHRGPHALSPDLAVAGFKLFADGALGSRGAALKDDYTDEPHHRGQLADPETLIAKARRAAALGYPVAIHAIGDRGNLLALEAIEAAHAVRPGLAHRIEHLQVLDLESDLARLKSSGAIASMQPTHATSDSRWAEARLGPLRIRGAYAWKTLANAQISLAFGSDAPVESYRPLLGLFAALTRRLPEPNSAPFYPDERLDFRTAIDAFSRGAMLASPVTGFRTSKPSETGLRIGAPFEVTLLDRDLREGDALDPERLLDAVILGTLRSEPHLVLRHESLP